MTAGLFRSLSREAAARFSFLLAVPVTAAAAVSELLGHADTSAIDAQAFFFGAILSAVTGIACIHYFLKWLTRFGMLPYVLYRLALGVVLLVLFA
jgi:undecaprenyl-diphosphatase